MNGICGNRMSPFQGLWLWDRLGRRALPYADDVKAFSLDERKRYHIKRAVFCILVLVFCGNNFAYSQRCNTTVPPRIIGNDTIYVVEEPPRFPSEEREDEILGVVVTSKSEIARLRYLKENLRYPNDAIVDSNFQRIVYVRFCVGINGEISEVEVIRGIGSGYDEEAIRLVKGMPNWIPAKQRGRPVSISHVMAIKFPPDEIPINERQEDIPRRRNRNRR